MHVTFMHVNEYLSTITEYSYRMHACTRKECTNVCIEDNQIDSVNYLVPEKAWTATNDEKPIRLYYM